MNTWTQLQSIILSWHGLLVFAAVLRQLSFFIPFCLPLSLLLHLPHCLLVHRAELEVLDYNLTWPWPGFCVWNIQMALVKKTARLRPTSPSLCLEWTVLSEKQLTCGRPGTYRQCWLERPFNCGQHVHLCVWTDSDIENTAQLWPNWPPSCLEHRVLVRKTACLWTTCPFLRLTCKECFQISPLQTAVAPKLPFHDITHINTSC